MGARTADPTERPLFPPAPTPPRWGRDVLRRQLLGAADLIAILVATLVVGLGSESAWGLLFAPLSIIVAKLVGLYDRDHRALSHMTIDELPTLIVWAGAVSALLTLLLPLTPTDSLDAVHGLGFFVALSVAVLTLRPLARWIWRKRTPPEKVAMIGTADALNSMRRKFGMLGGMHFELAVVKEIDDMGQGLVRARYVHELVESVDRIVVAAVSVERDMIEELSALCSHEQTKLTVASPLGIGGMSSPNISQLGHMTLFEYRTWDPSRSTLLIKRTLDIAIASIGLLVVLPVLAVAAIAIKLDSRGPVIFSQIRAGLRGRPFRMYKLRTMSTDAESRLPELVDINALNEPVFKIQGDPRVTRVGRLLRRFSLDEVPQLFNVLLGEMSLVGPRPEQVELVDRYSSEQRVRLAVKPGVTGPMQVMGRGELTFSERLAVELEYVHEPSLSRDLQIMLRTIPVVVRGMGAY